jgi:hypothetical protein
MQDYADSTRTVYQVDYMQGLDSTYGVCLRACASGYAVRSTAQTRPVGRQYGDVAVLLSRLSRGSRLISFESQTLKSNRLIS